MQNRIFCSSFFMIPCHMFKSVQSFTFNYFQYSWTPLLVAAMGFHVEVVNLLLEYRPNVNALDKDGCTALTIACKEGYHDIAVSLLNVGAYINIQVSFTEN